MEKIINKTNILLVKDDVGRAKPATFKLPEGRTYGKPENRTAEGAGAIVSTWKNSEPSVLPKSIIPMDFKKLNKAVAASADPASSVVVSLI